MFLCYGKINEYYYFNFTKLWQKEEHTQKKIKRKQRNQRNSFFKKRPKRVLFAFCLGDIIIFMKKAILFLILFIIFVVGAMVFLPKNKAVAPTHNATSTQSAVSYKDATYKIDDQPVTLKGGLSETTIEGSLSSVRTMYFGNEARGDVNGDGKEDVAFLITQNGGGTGTFYFLAVALGNEGGYRGINTVFIGDRIAPQNTEIKNGVITVNYADRLPSEAMVSEPTIGVSRYFKVQNDNLVEIKGEMGE